MKAGSCSLLLLVLIVSVGCETEGRGFRLPAGNADTGKATFVELGCNDCHHVRGVEHATGTETGLDVPLGGSVTRIKTYGELVTSIINPSHKIARTYPPQPVAVDGESAMRAYNSVMTVEQLVDLVTFLETEYELHVPPSYF